MSLATCEQSKWRPARRQPEFFEYFFTKKYKQTLPLKQEKLTGHREIKARILPPLSRFALKPFGHSLGNINVPSSQAMLTRIAPSVGGAQLFEKPSALVNIYSFAFARSLIFAVVVF